MFGCGSPIINQADMDVESFSVVHILLLPKVSFHFIGNILKFKIVLPCGLFFTFYYLYINNEFYGKRELSHSLLSPLFLLLFSPSFLFSLFPFLFVKTPAPAPKKCRPNCWSMLNGATERTPQRTAHFVCKKEGIEIHHEGTSIKIQYSEDCCKQQNNSATVKQIY